VISEIALTLRAPYGITSRSGAPLIGAIGWSFISHASITWGCIMVGIPSSTQEPSCEITRQ